MTEPHNQPVWGGPPPEPAPPPEPGPPPPRPPDAPRPWGVGATLGWTVLIALAFIASAFGSIHVFTRYVDPASHTPESLMTNGNLFWINSFITLAAVGAVVAAAVALRAGITPAQYLALKPVPARSYLLWAGVLLAANVATELFLRLAGIDSMPAWMTAVGKDVSCPACFFLAVVFAAPFLEELVFRGFIFAGLRPRLGPHFTVVLSVVPWALLHAQYQPIYVAAVMALGLVLGYARERTGSLLAPLALHCLNNLFGYWQMVSG